MKDWLADLEATVAREGPTVRVMVSAHAGSTPRETGTAMLVTSRTVDGTIGGGELEHRAIAEARDLLDDSRTGAGRAAWRRRETSLPLGPALGQCCGGHVRLLFEVVCDAELAALARVAPDAGTTGLLARPLADGAPAQRLGDRHAVPDDWPLAVQRRARDMLAGARPPETCRIHGTQGAVDWLIEPLASGATPLFLYGAGHVGRAVVRVFEDLPFALTWIDTAPDRFPADPPAHVTPVPATRPERIAAAAPDDAMHVVMTFSHARDLAICDAVLSRQNFAWLGLIGSRTKRRRFVARLRQLGHDERRIARMVCPIGLPALAGKEPAVIAVSLAADLLQARSALANGTGETSETRSEPG